MNRQSTSRPWGHCQHCRYFDSPAHLPLPTEEARCRQQELAKYELVVFGASGCRAYELRAGLRPDVETPASNIVAGAHS